ncbi:hypothetical protein [Stutzerimonas tarimensis]|uniref:Lipoprotein n=1 Tax=Stutzerimonas tarimensis TaxID=1507735 RepID=A0ABV7T0K0_9GAMM
MRIPLILILTLSTLGCSGRGAADRYLDEAYRHYAADNCEKTALALSQAERMLRSGNPVQSEISLLRGHCLERQMLYVDAAQTYLFIQSRYPATEYAYRARARLETLRQLGHYQEGTPALAHPVGR